ncbi:hypothetical protein EVAR_43435_1 [Eumeta japonica]|uniref:Uncharacterized protein n=1 Tax=Eumeta variegata TaxID=151549 RepID=A0A4C1WVB1_EUMVA|nr:hypothetical protein EVAR_43435_1 [Eumeta japonica]
MADILRGALVGRTEEWVMHSRLYKPEHFRLTLSVRVQWPTEEPRRRGEAAPTEEGKASQWTDHMPCRMNNRWGRNAFERRLRIEHRNVGGAPSRRSDDLVKVTDHRLLSVARDRVYIVEI